MFWTVTEQGTTIDSPKFGGDGGRRDKAGTPFSLVMKEGGAIVGFHGHCGAYLDAIGVYLQKLTPPTLSKELPEAKNSEPNEHVVEEIEIHDENQVNYDQANSILVEPWGGNTGGSEWNYKLKSPIKEILIAHGDFIHSIMFRTITEQATIIDSPMFGGDGGRRDKVSPEKLWLTYLFLMIGTFFSS
ncbi:agglutinin-like isoform X3 [Nicotiana tabacum]|uniref:Agglutinin-like isoform X3 n=1 Tax=Nicotiana tabacum TaxID=4097 RepID=A0AC58SYM0_TOBAC